MQKVKGLFYIFIVLTAVLFPTAFAFGATTVGDNVSVEGTLGINGVSTLTGNVFVTGTLQSTGALTTYGAVTLGDATGDDITVTGYIASNILPKTNNTYDLGAFAKAYNDVFASGTSYLQDIDINGLAYTWPSSQGGASAVLTNNGSGVLSWGAAGSGTNDWGRFSSTYGASSLMTSSTYPVWFDGAVYASSSVKIAGGTNSYLDIGGDGDGASQLYLKATSTTAVPLLIQDSSGVGMFSFSSSSMNIIGGGGEILAGNTIY